MVWYWQVLFLHQACHGLWPPARNKAPLSSLERGLPCLQEKKEKTEKKDKKSILESNNIETGLGTLVPLRHFCGGSWVLKPNKLNAYWCWLADLARPGRSVHSKCHCALTAWFQSSCHWSLMIPYIHTYIHIYIYIHAYNHIYVIYIYISLYSWL